MEGLKTFGINLLMLFGVLFIATWYQPVVLGKVIVLEPPFGVLEGGKGK